MNKFLKTLKYKYFFILVFDKTKLNFFKPNIQSVRTKPLFLHVWRLDEDTVKITK